jgi:myosin heavy subunit
VNGLRDEDLGRLCTLEEFNWGLLNESVGRCLIATRAELLRARQDSGELRDQVREHEREIADLRSQIEQQGREIDDVRKEVEREQNEKAVMKAANDEQQLRIGALDVESRGQEGTIVRQESEIDDLKTAKKKTEDELTQSIKENDALKRELAQLKEEMKAMQVKQDPLLEEIGRLKEEVRQMTRTQPPPEPAPEEVSPPPTPPKKAKQFPPSMKKGKLRLRDGRSQTADVYDIPDGIIAHLTRECGGNISKQNVVDVTCGSFENPQAEVYNPDYAAKNAADLETKSFFLSSYNHLTLRHC